MNKTVRNLLMAAVLACGVHAVALAAAGASAAARPATVTFDACSWNKPGVDPFMGDVVAAVDRYRDIPVDVRERLKARMAKREYDDLVSIRRDSINGRAGYDYGNTISEMHFGTHQVCRSVTRAAWTPAMEERGLVYCESGHCILVPTVCRNVSRIARRGVGSETAEGLPLFDAPGAGPAEPVVAMGDMPPIDYFGPTGAGVPDGVAGPLSSGNGGFGPAGGSSFASGLGGLAGPSGLGGIGSGSGGGLGGGSGAGPAVAPTVSASAAPLPGTNVPVVIPVVTAVPEPQTWALMLGGLGALAAIARRRRAAR